MSSRRMQWTFDGLKVLWMPRMRVFRIMFSDDGGHSVQTVPVDDTKRIAEIKRSLDAGMCPTDSPEGLWPVPVRPDCAVPSDSEWRIRRYAVAVFSAESELMPPTGYTDDPDGAVEEAMRIWDSMTDDERSACTVMACEIRDDFPVSHEWESCLWVSDPEMFNEGAWSGTLRIAKSGNSAVLRISQICDRLGLSVGDDVEVVIRRRRRAGPHDKKDPSGMLSRSGTMGTACGYFNNPDVRTRSVQKCSSILFRRIPCANTFSRRDSSFL